MSLTRSVRHTVQDLTNGISGHCQKSYRTYDEALASYSSAYHKGTVKVIVKPGSQYDKPLIDRYGHPAFDHHGNPVPGREDLNVESLTGSMAGLSFV